MFEEKKTLPMTPKKESHFNMPRAIPASTGIPVVEPSGHKCCRAGHTGQLYIVRQAVTPVHTGGVDKFTTSKAAGGRSSQ